MTLEEIKKNAPDGATHYTSIMFFGVIYLKHVSGQSWWWHEKTVKWDKTNADYVDGLPL